MNIPQIDRDAVNVFARTKSLLRNPFHSAKNYCNIGYLKRIIPVFRSDDVMLKLGRLNHRNGDRTPEVLKGVEKQTLNNMLVEAIRIVCTEGSAEMGFEVIDRLVEAGTRMEAMIYTSAQLKEAATLTIKSRAARSCLRQKNPPGLGEKIPLLGDIKEYVDRLVINGFVIYSEEPMERGRPTRKSLFQQALEGKVSVRGRR